MADFNPDKFLADTAPSAPAQGVTQFNPDKFLAETAGPYPKPKPEGIEGTANAIMRGAAQGGSAGFADEMTAGVGGLKDYIAGKLGLRGDISLGDAYKTWRDNIRKADAQAEAEHPTAFAGGELAGGLASAFVPGAKALNVGKGAGLVEAGIKGAALGAAAGAGHAKDVADIPDEMISGAKTGALLGSAFNIGGRALGAVAEKLSPAKVGAVLLNAPESALQRYIENPEAVNASRSRADIVQNELIPRIEKLQQDVVEGSQASREILAQEGKTVSGDQIADILKAKADDIVKRSEGIMDDPRKIAAVNFLNDTAKKYRSGISDDLSEELGKVIGATPAEMAADKAKVVSTNRVKDLLQTLDGVTEYQSAPGQFGRIDDLAKKDVRSQIDSLLKSESPAYAEQMKGVASDTAMLKDVSELARSPQGFDNLLKRTQRGNTPHLLDALKAFDERTGGGLLDELQNSAVKDALDKGAMNGSRNVNLHGAAGDAIGSAFGGLPGKVIGRTLGLLGGATVDKYGPAIARKIVDSTARANALLDSSEGIQALGKYAEPLMHAAMNGNKTLAATNAYLLATSPEYNQIINPVPSQDAIRRRLGE